jgi:hypothetical protein
MLCNFIVTKNGPISCTEIFLLYFFTSLVRLLTWMSYKIAMNILRFTLKYFSLKLYFCTRTGWEKAWNQKETVVFGFIGRTCTNLINRIWNTRFMPLTWVTYSLLFFAAVIYQNSPQPPKHLLQLPKALQQQRNHPLHHRKPQWKQPRKQPRLLVQVRSLIKIIVEFSKLIPSW